jgi:hypothetical protein
MNPGDNPRNRFFRIMKRRRLFLAIGLLAAAASPVAVYYYLGYTSVNSIVLALELEIYRARTADNTSITFHIPAMAFSRQMPLDVELTAPTFTLESDSIPVGTISPSGATVHSHHCLVFPLNFQTTNSDDAKMLAARVSNNIILTMTTRLSSGLYSQYVAKSISQQVYDAPIRVDSYACTLDVLPPSANS